jgi:hypothetical protein
MPAEASEVAEGEFEITDFDEFDPLDNSIVPQFIPGDIVTIRKLNPADAEFWAADKLIRQSSREEKRYFEFLYRTVTGDKLKDAIERYQFRHVIKRIRDEINDEGKWHYPAVENYVKGVETKRK